MSRPLGSQVLEAGFGDRGLQHTAWALDSCPPLPCRACPDLVPHLQRREGGACTCPEAAGRGVQPLGWQDWSEGQFIHSPTSAPPCSPARPFSYPQVPHTSDKVQDRTGEQSWAGHPHCRGTLPTLILYLLPTARLPVAHPTRLRSTDPWAPSRIEATWPSGQEHGYQVDLLGFKCGFATCLGKLLLPCEPRPSDWWERVGMKWVHTRWGAGVAHTAPTPSRPL